MKSLRDLLLSLLTAIRTLLERRHARGPRPVRGPAHPWHHARRAAPRPTTGAAEPAPPAGPPPRRGAPPLPPHLAALLARAPEIEPEYVRPLVLFRTLPTRVRVYAPARPAPAPRARPETRASLAVRFTRLVDPILWWLARASPARRVRA